MPKKQVDVGVPHQGFYRPCHCQRWQLVAEGSSWRACWLRVLEAIQDRSDDDLELVVLPLGHEPDPGQLAPARQSLDWTQGSLFD